MELGYSKKRGACPAATDGTCARINARALGCVLRRCGTHAVARRGARVAVCAARRCAQAKQPASCPRARRLCVGPSCGFEAAHASAPRSVQTCTHHPNRRSRAGRGATGAACRAQLFEARSRMTHTLPRQPRAPAWRYFLSASPPFSALFLAAFSASAFASLQSEDRAARGVNGGRATAPHTQEARHSGSRRQGWPKPAALAVPAAGAPLPARRCQRARCRNAPLLALRGRQPVLLVLRQLRVALLRARAVRVALRTRADGGGTRRGPASVARARSSTRVERRTRCERRVREKGFPCGAARTPSRRTRLVAARHCSRCV